MKPAKPPPKQPLTADQLLELGGQWLAAPRKRLNAQQYDRFLPLLEKCTAGGMSVTDIVRRLVDAGQIPETQVKNTQEAFYRHLRKRLNTKVSQREADSQR